MSLSLSPFALVSASLFAGAAAAAPNGRPSQPPLPRRRRRSLPDLDHNEGREHDGEEDSQSTSRLTSSERDAEFVRRYVSSAGTHDVQSALNGQIAPTKTIPSKSLVGTATRLSRRQTSIAAYSSGIIADWTHQSRSVWFQRKVIIIISCFLAIFIVLTIGAAVFLRDRSADDDDEDAEDLSDEAALKRMREERRMRSGTRKNKGLAGAEKKAAGDGGGAGGAGGEEEGAGVASRNKLRLSRNRRKKVDKEGSSSGSSTAVSRRLVSRWIKTPGAPHSNGQSSSSAIATPDSSSAVLAANAAQGGNADDSASIRSSSSRRSRLGGRRSERIEVEYHAGDAGSSGGNNGDGGREEDANAHQSSSLTSSTSRVASRTSSDREGARQARLDASDLQAADSAATNHAHDALPPAYIGATHGQGSSGSGGSGSTHLHHPPPPSSSPPPQLPAATTYQRPLAGDGGVDSKGGRVNVRVTPPMPMVGLSGEERETGDADTSSAAAAVTSHHIATDDKNALAALAASASAPRYDRGNSGGEASAGGDDAAIMAPSAPAVDDDDDGHGDGVGAQDLAGLSAAGATPMNAAVLDGQPSSSTAPQYEGNAGVDGIDRDEKGKGKAAVSSDAGILPRPPAPHSQAYSPFDRPYHQSPFDTAAAATAGTGAMTMSRQPSQRSMTTPARIATPATTAAPIAAPPSHQQSRASEKQREAEGELAALVASAPPTAATVAAAAAAAAAEGLPAYEGAPPPSASAPDVDDLALDAEDGSASAATAMSMAGGSAGAGAGAGTAATPSAPPLDDDGGEDENAGDQPR